jgi:hypothetical protein
VCGVCLFPTTVNAVELFREVLEGRGLPVETAEVAEVELDARGSQLQQQLFGPASGAVVVGARQPERRCGSPTR